jgi:hypothetical protein
VCERQQPWIVEISGDDDSLLLPGGFEERDVRGVSEADLGRVDRVMTSGA